MALNTLRLNHQKSSHPNDRIVFIKPLPRPSTHQSDYDTADLFLRAIAAQCLPIMKTHWLAVTTLEEYEPNREFMGRNFNHGECIQLVLKSKSGRWLPFNMVQMVMMHELAHNVEMNHSKRFWAKRNEYAGEMRELWGKGYTGEGFWGSGRALGEMGSVMGNNVMRSEELQDLPLCGGTYRSRRRKRKAGGQQQELTWKEKKERRIEKKFGKNGVSLGSDEDQRMLYEMGKGPVGGNPRVAQSKRGRELRAAAALARFEQSKKEPKEEVKEETEDDDGDYEDIDVDMEDATDLDGQRLLDASGRSMVRICGEEDTDDVQVKQELEELEGLERYFPRLPKKQPEHDSNGENPRVPANDGQLEQELGGSDTTTATASPTPEPHPPSDNPQPPSPNPPPNDTTQPALPTTAPPSPAAPAPAPTPPSTSSNLTCPICSLANPPVSPTCLACSHVLDTQKDPRHWRCRSQTCRESRYVNAGDAGVCGICGARRP
ncbi:uncharacterized protein HMPREF1541_06058 [Cyphellophora europaea CBS 101466]|uniref:WLM domain-containing protein n=1 Tax=Cyphellophora europaea (strain CBS 101466) TaxID=1220924 RepID=W2RTR2_CYPE1|nr:uncharacterized protein HMPREF1541_06058 [Cyphellophora europaea CBS 101466]ETN39832.1 hypothetical protein HMPREF1541_06058 [Cyphellophora europaea CBS 101466]